MSRIFIQKLKYDWNLFKIDEITSKNYFETYQKNDELQYLHDWASLIPSNTNINNNIYANEIIYGNLKQKDWSFVDLNDKFKEVYGDVIQFIRKESLESIKNKSSTTISINDLFHSLLLSK